MSDPFSLSCSEHSSSLVGVSAERPFAIDVLPGFDHSHDRQVVIGYLHTDRYQIDVRMVSELLGIGKRQWDPEMLRRRLSRILPGCADGADLELWKRLQGRDMGDRGKSAARTYPYNANADLVACRHR